MTAEIQNQAMTIEFAQQQLKAEGLRSKSLEEQLETEKLKTQGMQMLFDCVQEEHCENRRLKIILKKRRLALRKIKKQLQTNPNSFSKINWDELSDFSEVDEVTERGIKNGNLRQDSKEDQQCQQLESLSRSLNGTGLSVEQLQKRLEQLTRENEQLTAQLMSSDSEKDVEILNLRTQLCSLEQSRKVNGILCETLSEEAVVLKRHLMETVEMCQKLMRTLEMKQGCIRKITNIKSSLDNANGVDITVPTLQQQYENLESQLKEVVTMNSRWQQYNEQREEYVQQLLQRNVELEQAVINRGQQLSLGQQERIDQTLVDQRQKLEIAKEDNSILKKENQNLKNSLEQMKTDNNSVIKKLHQQILQKTAKYETSIRENEALNFQMQMYREDFESERKDRERAQDHITQLEAQIRSATQQLSLNRANVSPEQLHASNPNLSRNLSFSSDASLVGRGAVSLFPEDRSDYGELDLRPSD